jgi:hypothetical protein
VLHLGFISFCFTLDYLSLMTWLVYLVWSLRLTKMFFPFPFLFSFLFFFIWLAIILPSSPFFISLTNFFFQIPMILFLCKLVHLLSSTIFFYHLIKLYQFFFCASSHVFFTSLKYACVAQASFFKR